MNLDEGVQINKGVECLKGLKMFKANLIGKNIIKSFSFCEFVQSIKFCYANAQSFSPFLIATRMNKNL